MRPPRILSLYVAFALFACSAEAPPPEAYPDAVQADPDHYSTIYENDVARILQIDYGPGEQSVMHHHPEHCWVMIGDSEWTMATPDGATQVVPGTSGDFGCVEPGPHSPTNSGVGPATVIAFEIKDGATAGSDVIEGADAAEIDPAHYSVEFENDAVRIIRIAYGPDEEGVLHGHPANCIVWLTVPEGEDAPALGDFQCNDAATHTPAPGGSAVELIGIEFIGRATAEQ
jgi:hypothetical protein